MAEDTCPTLGEGCACHLPEDPKSLGWGEWHPPTYWILNNPILLEEEVEAQHFSLFYVAENKAKIKP